MTHPHPRALEAAARATYEARFQRLKPHVPWESLDASYSGEAEYNRNITRAAVTAYLDALPPPVSPELIAKLSKLASRLTEMGEYEAVDLIDTVVARVTPALAGTGEK